MNLSTESASVSSRTTTPSQGAASVNGETALSAEAAQDHRLRILAILSALLAFASISTDLYLSALPGMGAALRASDGSVELTISGYLVGFSLSQLIWGPISDRYGRRLPIAIGLILFSIGSAGCALSTSAAMLIGCRAVQAIGACASVVIARAMVRDLYTGHRAAQMMSTLMTVMAVAPLVGPSVGGMILFFYSWRAIFWTLVGVGLATLVSLHWLPETLPHERRNRAPLTGAIRNYGELLKNRRILGYAGACGFFYGAIFAYIAGTPFIYITYHHVSPQHYGLLFAAGIIGVMLSNQINSRLVRSMGSDRLMKYGTLGALVASCMLALDARNNWGGLYGIVIPLLAFLSATGFVGANSIAGALKTAPTRAGAVSALIGSIQYGTGIFGSALVGLFADGTPWPIAAIIVVMCLGSVICAWFFVRGRRSKF